ncbi:OpgC family protein [Inquilinus limosus]|uniref:Membrane protein n=1 Tax=Inquilinus limosus MP06 TaxID=1398085 RepID=A0A0A0CXD1_9PROT|nr:OpgC domain-containing protein [Inquilinus limosus]KGM30410.1 membrane protein [Inquilinus limosus MP06]
MTRPSELAGREALSSAPAGRTRRDPRLDVFRGLGMLIILTAHIPDNTWILWIPARFGFSDATEMFVFLSGMASAIAFGRVFDRDGFARGTGRVARRVWQIYWIHVAVFVVIAALVAAAGARPGGESYIVELNLPHFFADPMGLLPRFLTLTYVPNYFDILPMYLVILALMPAMILAERLYRALPFMLMAAIWGLTQAHLLDLPAEPWSDRPWFFDPFGWQLLFYLGFFLMRRTLPAPGFSWMLITLAVVFVLATVPFAYYRILEASPFFGGWARALEPLTDKTHFGILRLAHFLALAYLAAHLVGPGGTRLKGAAVAVISKVGQQTLAVFVSGMVAAQLLGMALDHTGRGPLATAAANLAGFAVLIAVAYAVAWFKAMPARTGGAPVAEAA